MSTLIGSRISKILSHSGIRWAGVMVLLLAYLLVSQGLISGKSISYNLINGLGSVFLIANSLAMKPRDWAVAVFNMVWLLVAMVSIAQTLL